MGKCGQFRTDPDGKAFLKTALLELTKAMMPKGEDQISSFVDMIQSTDLATMSLPITYSVTHFGGGYFDDWYSDQTLDFDLSYQLGNVNCMRSLLQNTDALFNRKSDCVISAHDLNRKGLIM